MRGKRPLLAFLGVTVAICQLVVAVLIAARKCGDDCRVVLGEPIRPGVQWWQDENAWQWGGQMWLAAANLAVVLAAAGFYLRGREREWRIATPAAGVMFALWAAAVQPVTL